MAATTLVRVAVAACGMLLAQAVNAEVVATRLAAAPAPSPAGGPGSEARAAPTWCPKAPPLPEPTGPVIRVTTVDELFRAAREVEPGGTILVADGHYLMPRYFEIRTDDVMLRGESGRRERVVLDGARSRHGELVGITGCAGVTVADLTIQNVKWNGFKINSDRFTTRVTIRNCVIHNVWQRGVKGPAVRPEDRDRFRPSDCRVRYCLFTNDRAKRFGDDPADRPENFGGNYVGGMDIMYPRRWTISDNVFVGIQGRTREARGAVFLWHEAEDCLVERNVIIDCDSGICLGNSHRPDDVPVHCTRCVVRNNFLARCPEQGVLADYTRDCRIVHNTVHDPGSRLRRLIRLVHHNGGLVVAGNLLSGPPMRVETDSPMTIENNFVENVVNWFVDPRAGDLHLKPGVLPDAARVPRRKAIAADIDGQPRPVSTAVGADEPREAR